MIFWQRHQKKILQFTLKFYQFINIHFISNQKIDDAFNYNIKDILYNTKLK